MLVLNDRPPAGQLFQVWTQWETGQADTPYENYNWAIDYDFSFAGQITEQNMYKSQSCGTKLMETIQGVEYKKVTD